MAIYMYMAIHLGPCGPVSATARVDCDRPTRARVDCDRPGQVLECCQTRLGEIRARNGPCALARACTESAGLGPKLWVLQPKVAAAAPGSKAPRPGPLLAGRAPAGGHVAGL